MTPVERLLSKLPGARRQGKGWVARCPAHEDRRPSLSVTEGDDGRALVHCHAGCPVESIVSALGMSMADLMPDRADQPDRPATPRAPRKKTDGPRKTYATAEEAVASLERRHGQPSHVYHYHDANGDTVGMVARWDGPTGKTILPVSRTPGGWIIGGMPAPRPLYRLPDLLARTGERVYVCEGEKAADAARAVGLIATTSPHGSKSAANADWSPLAGREVVILPDHDEPGAQYAASVASILARLTPPATVRIVNLVDAWPDLPAGGDIADVVRHEDVDTIKAKLAELVGRAAHRQTGPVVTCLDDVAESEIQWLWPGRIPLGRITLLVGRPGEGKSFLTCDMAARVSTGGLWPDGSPCPSGSVLLISAEDDPGDTIRPRVRAHGADLRKVHLLSAVRRTGADGKPYEAMFTLSDVANLEAALKTLPDCRLIVVDPIGSFIGHDTDAHRDNEVRSVLAPVAKLAEKYGAAVLVVAHRRKSSGSIADDLAIGSRAFTGIARAVWHLSRDSSDKSRRLLLPGKNNLAPEGNGLAFAIVGNPAAVVWERDPVAMSADDALAQEHGFSADAKPGPKPEATTQAVDWLRELLRNGPIAVTEIKGEAQAAGYAWRTLHRAKDELGIRPHREQPGGNWVWGLPQPPTYAQPIRVNHTQNGAPGAHWANNGDDWGEL